ncbi:conserved Plasmodium protein, unknown function [Plasmodium gallinaceum]|uniref:Uncharacterized protein n=1 Tax=Plasmodium gallinaceum TaxID=5849 RepID=A0A1J1H3D4_PLAGA|nr:conserved Plasmodium protein, unknown function [Plasmodium gallinaceum]CRG97855.1 conserved Plasmodium protein, unknown function [Plasmodium gallinaceum]
MMEYVSKSDNAYILIKICNLLDLNAINHVKAAIKNIILELFGLSMLLKAKYTILKIIDNNMFFILQTEVRFLSLFLYVIQPNNTKKYEFNLKVLKISNFLSNLTYLSNNILKIENH